MAKEFELTEDEITLHGLGFLQIKLEGNQRLHVWHPALPRRQCFEHSAVHDHRFGFTSRVLVGQQINLTFKEWPLDTPGLQPTHMSYLHEGPRTKFGNRPWIPDGALTISLDEVEAVDAGREYVMAPYRYHATQPGGDGRVATLMKKTTEGQDGAHSLCALGVTPDADFDRKQWSTERLWEIALEVLGASIADRLRATMGA